MPVRLSESIYLFSCRNSEDFKSAKIMCEKKEREQINHFFWKLNLFFGRFRHILDFIKGGGGAGLWGGGELGYLIFNQIGVIQIESTQNFLSRL